MGFVDNVVSIGESRKELIGMLEVWREVLEAQDIRLSRSKT